MKKILSMGIASAVLALTAVVASAEATSTPWLKAEQVTAKAVKGEQITFEVKVTEGGHTDAQFYVETSDNLKLVGLPSSPAQSSMYNPDNNKMVVANATEFDAGTAIATFTYEVIGDEGETVSFALLNDTDGGYAGAVVLDPITTAIGENTSSEPTSSEPTSSEPTSSEPTSSEPVSDNSDENNSGNESGDNSSNSNGTVPNPGTGIALAVVPAVIAGAAVVVAAKKRK